MVYVLGIDLGTSSVKVVLATATGQLIDEASCNYPLYTDKEGYSEQEVADWFNGTLKAITTLTTNHPDKAQQITALSFSGQMHGLVLLDKNGKPLRRAILWNDTRTTTECRLIEEQAIESLLTVTKNRALEGFTLPKILWVQKHEPAIFAQAKTFLLPKDYLCYCLTGHIGSEYSDAAGTLLLDIEQHCWSPNLFNLFNIDTAMAPPLVESAAVVGTLLPTIASHCGLKASVKVVAGGADNACGALGAGIVDAQHTLLSIGTSGVVLQVINQLPVKANGLLHFFNHAQPNSFYSMGVTLAAGGSLQWFKENFYTNETFNQLTTDAEQAVLGCEGLLFAPYLMGERTPYPDSHVRASFTGISARVGRKEFARAVMEGITFSLKDCFELIQQTNPSSTSLIATGGGAKSAFWLQMQADIFGLPIKAANGGPAMGAAILAAVGGGYFATISDAVKAFVTFGPTYQPNLKANQAYTNIYNRYKQVYKATSTLI